MNSWGTGLALLIILIVLWLIYVNIPPKGTEAFAPFDNDIYANRYRSQNWLNGSNLPLDEYNIGGRGNVYDRLNNWDGPNYGYGYNGFDGNYGYDYGYGGMTNPAELLFEDGSYLN
jgi:hypothetical protein